MDKKYIFIFLIGILLVGIATADIFERIDNVNKEITLSPNEKVKYSNIIDNSEISELIQYENYYKFFINFNDGTKREIRFERNAQQTEAEVISIRDNAIEDAIRDYIDKKENSQTPNIENPINIGGGGIITIK